MIAADVLQGFGEVNRIRAEELELEMPLFQIPLATAEDKQAFLRALQEMQLSPKQRKRIQEMRRKWADRGVAV